MLMQYSIDPLIAARKLRSKNIPINHVLNLNFNAGSSTTLLTMSTFYFYIFIIVMLEVLYQVINCEKIKNKITKISLICLINFILSNFIYLL